MIIITWELYNLWYQLPDSFIIYDNYYLGAFLILITRQLDNLWLQLVYLKDSNASSHFVNSLILFALSRTGILFAHALLCRKMRVTSGMRLLCVYANRKIGHYRNVRGLGKSMVVFRLFEKLRYSNERSIIF